MKQSGRKALEPSLLLFRAEKQRDELLSGVRKLQEDHYLAAMGGPMGPPEAAFRILVALADRIRESLSGEEEAR